VEIMEKIAKKNGERKAKNKKKARNLHIFFQKCSWLFEIFFDSFFTIIPIFFQDFLTKIF